MNQNLCSKSDKSNNLDGGAIYILCDSKNYIQEIYETYFLGNNADNGGALYLSSTNLKM